MLNDTIKEGTISRSWSEPPEAVAPDRDLAGAKAAGQDDYFHWKPSENMDWEPVSRSQNYILDSLGCAGKPVVGRTVSRPLPNGRRNFSTASGKRG